jgi:uncharacterized protein (DUF58 family)
MLKRYEPYQQNIMFMVNISESMTGVKIENAQATILHIFQKQLTQSDNIGLVVFHDIFQTVFPLSQRSKNTEQLEKIISLIPEFSRDLVTSRTHGDVVLLPPFRHCIREL